MSGTCKKCGGDLLTETCLWCKEDGCCPRCCEDNPHIKGHRGPESLDIGMLLLEPQEKRSRDLGVLDGDSDEKDIK